MQAEEHPATEGNLRAQKRGQRHPPRRSLELVYSLRRRKTRRQKRVLRLSQSAFWQREYVRRWLEQERAAPRKRKKKKRYVMSSSIAY
jgi:hypothetical protein